MDSAVAVKQENKNVVKLVIITRRFDSPDVKIISKTNRYPIADVTIPDNPLLIDSQNLGKFWFNVIVKDRFSELTKEKLLEDKSDKDNIDDLINNNYPFSRKLNHIPDGDLKNFKQNFLNIYINRFNSMQKLGVKTDYLTHIHELLHEADGTNIFIYHHWLDKQGLKDKRKEYLTSLRNDLISIMHQKKVDRDNIEINWLIHDTDILSENYDGLLWFDSFDGQGSKKSYHPTQDHENVKRQIPLALQKDNIWCFVHRKEIRSFYQRIILHIQDNEISFRNAEELYNKIVLDEFLFFERTNLLKDLGYDTTQLQLNQIAYLLDASFDESVDNQETIKNAVKEKIKLIQSIKSGLITEEIGKFIVDPKKLNIQATSDVNQQS